MALNKQHFQDGINKLSSQLNSSNKKNKIIEETKNKLLDLFLDDSAGLKSHEDVNKAFDQIKQLLENKKQEAEKNNNEVLSTQYKQLLLSNAWSKNHYSEQYLQHNTSTRERTQQLKALYHKIKEIESNKPKKKIPSNNKEERIKPTNRPTESESYKPGIKVKYNDKKYTIIDRDTTADGRIVYHLEDEEGKPLLSGGVKKYVGHDKLTTIDSNIESYPQNNLEKITTGQEQKPTSQQQRDELNKQQELGKLNQKLDFIQLLEDLNNEKNVSAKDSLGESYILSKNGDKYFAALADGSSPKDEISLSEIKKQFGGIHTTQELQIANPIKQQEKLTQKQSSKIKNNLTSQQQQIIDDINANKKLRLIDRNGTPFDVYKEGDQYYAVDRSNQVGEQTRTEQSLDDIINNFTKPKNSNDIVQQTSKEIVDLFTIDAHLMDKENLIYESERNRIRDESARKYEQANWLRKIEMFGLDRRRQRKKVRQSIDDARTNSNFIETGSLQDRIEGNIGTYAQQDAMNIANNNIQATKDLGSDARINSIADLYLTGNITEEQAIAQFNIELARVKNSQDDTTKKDLGMMTGTDLMVKLNNDKYQKSYRIQQAIVNTITNRTDPLTPELIASIKHTLSSTLNKGRENNPLPTVSEQDIITEHEKLVESLVQQNIQSLQDKTAKINIKLIGLVKKQDTEELEGVRYDKYDKGVNKRFAQILQKAEQKTGIPRFALTTLSKIGVAAGGALLFNPLTGLITATGYGMFLQYMKTQRDTLQESAKTHEDAINIGITELNNRIKEVENNINHASKFAKVGARFGRNALHRNKKQLAILQSFAQMRNTDVLQSVDVLIDDLKTKTGHQQQTALADTLARIDAGHDLDTQFISTTRADGTGYGREQTAIKRNELMNEMKVAAFATPLYTIDNQGKTITTTVDKNSNKDDRTHYRTTLKKSTDYTATYNRLNTNYIQVQKDISKNRNKQSLQAVGNYGKNALAAAAVLGGIKMGIDGINNTFDPWSQKTIPGAGDKITTDYTMTEEARFKLSGHEINPGDPNLKVEGSLIDGTHITEMKGEVAVDAVASKAGAFANHMDKINDIRNYVDTAGLNPTTTKAFQEALSDDYISNIMKIAEDSGADIGNRKLMALRRGEMIEHTTQYLKDHNLTNVQIDTVSFDDIASPMEIQKSVIGGTADMTHRGFNVVLEGKNTITGDKVTTVFNPDYRSNERRSGYEYSGLLPFSNTYAKTQTQDKNQSSSQ